jgi:hypothetical protein
MWVIGYITRVAKHAKCEALYDNIQQLLQIDVSWDSTGVQVLVPMQQIFCIQSIYKKKKDRLILFLQAALTVQ